jgi:hypothetical protein
VIAMENWKTDLHRYLAYCEANSPVPKDLTAFGDRPGSDRIGAGRGEEAGFFVTFVI